MFKKRVVVGTSVASPRNVVLLLVMGLLLPFVMGLGSAGAADNFGLPGTYGLKIYHVNEVLYPYVQVYFRTFDKNGDPLINLNERNVGLMVKGRPYDHMKKQFAVQPIKQRPEATRTAIVLDASKSMEGEPFNKARLACARFIDSKRPQDEVAILAIRDTKEGYEIISEYERDTQALGRRLSDVRCDGKKTRLYDAIGAAMESCGMTSQGSISSEGRYISSCSVVVFSDGQDDGSAVTREELNSRISTMRIPIPIYSVAYSRLNQKYFQNLEALSKNSVGKYYLVGDAFERMQKVVEEIQNIVQSDYVLTFRSYLPVDGNEHALKIGIEYPSGSGKFTFDTGKFDAVELPMVGPIKKSMEEVEAALPGLPQGMDPYMDRAVPQQAAKPPTQ